MIAVGPCFETWRGTAYRWCSAVRWLVVGPAGRWRWRRTSRRNWDIAAVGGISNNKLLSPFVVSGSMGVTIGSRSRRDAEELCSVRGDLRGGLREARRALEAVARAVVRVSLARGTRQPTKAQSLEQTTRAVACKSSSWSPNCRSRGGLHKKSANSDERRNRLFYFAELMPRAREDATSVQPHLPRHWLLR